jgi:hypothetical protein
MLINKIPKNIYEKKVKKKPSKKNRATENIFKM